MKVYIAGPMTGYPEFNAPAFRAAAAKLRFNGYDVVSPLEVDEAHGMNHVQGFMEQGVTWGDLLARDVKIIADDGIDGIAVLPGWEASKGARLEVFTAMLLNLPVYKVERMQLAYTRGELFEILRFSL